MLIAETDHIFMTEPPNRATPTVPACFPFGYMNAKAPELKPVVARFVDDPEAVDPCGPSPVLIHVDLLRRLTPEWLKLSFELKRDAEANKIFGWVLEMWGYNRTRCAEDTLYTPHCDAPRPLTHLLLRHVSARGSGGTEHGHSSHGE